MSDLTEEGLARVTKALSLILRHNQGNKIDIDRFGYADVAELCAVLSKLDRFPEGFDPAWIAAAVNDAGKKRFGFSLDGKQIRALAGHSFEVELGLEPYSPAAPLYFGTIGKKRVDIDTHGFTQSTKLKVRLLEEYDDAMAIAVTRGDNPIVITIDAVKLHQDGWVLEKSVTGEVLCDHFPADYCSFDEPASTPKL